ncbi:MAG: hypothetical protein ACKODH_04315 [Limisphaerales bacterium]
MKHLPALLAILFGAQLSARAQAPTIVKFDSAKVTAGEALPGSNCVVTVSFQIQAGYYLHPNRPTLPRVTPTTVQVGTLGLTRALPAAYAAPGQKTIPGNPAPVPVYEGALTAQIPVVIAPNAVFPISLPGVVSYAPVNEKTHTPGRPEQVRFTVSIPRGTNPPPANAKSPTPDPKKK